MRKPKVKFILTETPVFYLLDFPSVSLERDTEEGAKLVEENEQYEYLTSGKGRNRKTVDEEIQTFSRIQKSRFTRAQQIERKKNHAFASQWDIFDTYGNIPTDKSITTLAIETIPVTIPKSGDQNYEKYKIFLQQQMQELQQNLRFQHCVTVIERILANNVYNYEQKRFRGLVEQDPFRPDIEFKYRLEFLWTFKNAKTEGHPVSAMHWNPQNSDLLAVGYGKFFYSDDKTGIFYCWNVKNPSQPEREFYFTQPVSSIAFSNFDPNLIAVGLYDGTVDVLEISTKNVKLLFTTCGQFSLSYEPIWQIIWMPPDDYNPKDEYLVNTCQDGRITRLIMQPTTQEVVQVPLMRITPIEGEVKGVEHVKSCSVKEIPITKHPAALAITKHAIDKDKYYVGTDEGAIHKCSRNNLDQHIDSFLAHSGPVYTIQFSPFCNNLFLTCGADWCVNVWAEDINEPLVTLNTPMEAVEAAAWSLANSSIIANVAGSDIYLWDLQRRTYSPTSVHKNPLDCRNTLVQFTESGKNLVVSDIEGNVHIYALEDMPFPPFYQVDMLTQVVRNNLVTKTDLVTKLDRISTSRPLSRVTQVQAVA